MQNVTFTALIYETQVQNIHGYTPESKTGKNRDKVQNTCPVRFEEVWQGLGGNIAQSPANQSLLIHGNPCQTEHALKPSEIKYQELTLHA